MPYKNKEDRIEASRLYHIKNKEKINYYVKAWSKKNAEKCREYSRRKNRKRTLKGMNNKKYAERKAMILENAKHWRKRFPEKAKNQELKKKYGISLEVYTETLRLQEFKCASCYISFNDKIKPNVDHCHSTGSFRGILCRTCNIVEGFLSKKSQIIECVKAYLSRGLQTPSLRS